MTELRLEHKIMPAQRLNGESSLPPVNQIWPGTGYAKTNLDEDDDFWAGYGHVASCYPYRMQDMYTRELYDTDFLMPVLENDYLKATFMPDYGGKLWSLIDKVTGKELFMANPVVRPCNLAIRNAWTSGGVEWNCGFLGHHPHTCSRIFTAVAELEDGTPVLRMYEYERLRQVVYQMDSFLPEGSRLLYCRMRIVNDHPYPVPMYWWSNIAVPELKGARVIAPVTQTYTYIDGAIAKTDVPYPSTFNTDITYPTNLGHSVDFFWKIPPEDRKYICQLDSDGYGLIQSSTKRLKGRKLFVWGQGPGGDRWQQYLTSDDGNGRYAEIQCGLAQSQYESIPMPPRSAWEWMEVYGAMQADPAKIHGDWADARAEVSYRLNELIGEEELEDMLKATKKAALTPAKETILTGGGWGALENIRREKAGENTLCPHLDFAEGDMREQQQWIDLLKNGSFGMKRPDDVPASWMLSEEWTPMITAAAKGGDSYSWYAQLQYGMTMLALRDYEKAGEALDLSYKLMPSAWALYGLAQLARIEKKRDKWAMLTLQSAQMKPDDASLVKEALRVLTETEKWQLLLDFASTLSEELLAMPRIRLTVAFANVKAGYIGKAEEMLYEGGGLLVADIREGEVSITELWYLIEEAKAKLEGKEFDRAKAKPPKMFDYRMFAEN